MLTTPLLHIVTNTVTVNCLIQARVLDFNLDLALKWPCNLKCWKKNAWIVFENEKKALKFGILLEPIRRVMEVDEELTAATFNFWNVYCL